MIALFFLRVLLSFRGTKRFFSNSVYHLLSSTKRFLCDIQQGRCQNSTPDLRLLYISTDWRVCLDSPRPCQQCNRRPHQPHPFSRSRPGEQFSVPGEQTEPGDLDQGQEDLLCSGPVWPGGLWSSLLRRWRLHSLLPQWTRPLYPSQGRDQVPSCSGAP